MDNGPEARPTDSRARPIVALHYPVTSAANIDFRSRAAPERSIIPDLPPISGRLKERHEDFLVDEIPLYDPCGEGEHIYLYIEKVGMTTRRLVQHLAKHFGVRPSAIGHAGLKDRHAITRQVISVHTPGKRPEDFPEIRLDNVAVLWVDLHTNKLRTGHLKGNRFSIRIRGVNPSAAVIAHKALRRLAQTGVPDRFGTQRFGTLGRNHLLGRALIRGDCQAFLDTMLGTYTDALPAHKTFRAAYDEGRFDDALRNLIVRGHDVNVVQILAPDEAEPELGPVVAELRKPRAARPVVRVLRNAALAVDRFERTYFVTACQSAIFNHVLDLRLADGTFGTLLEGDLAMRLEGRTAFAATAERLSRPELLADVEAFRVSPSGPMWGPDMSRPTGKPLELEFEALHAAGLEEAHVNSMRKALTGATPGARRPLRVALIDPECEGGVDEHGPYVRCAFELPRGAFATAVMAEIMKAGPEDLSLATDDAPAKREEP